MELLHKIDSYIRKIDTKIGPRLAIGSALTALAISTLICVNDGKKEVNIDLRAPGAAGLATPRPGQ